MRKALHTGLLLLMCLVLASAVPEAAFSQKKGAAGKASTRQNSPSKKKSSASLKKRAAVPSAGRTARVVPAKKPARERSAAATPARKNATSATPSRRKSRTAVVVPKQRAGSAARTSSATRTSSAARTSSATRTGSAATKPSPATRTTTGSEGGSAPLPKSIRLKQEELERVRAEIRDYEQRLASGKARERSTLERLDDVERQTTLIRTLVTNLNGQIVDNEQDIKGTVTELTTAEQELARLKAAYARSIVGAYKRGRLHDTELLLSSRSLNLMFIRAQYLKAFIHRQQSAAEAIHLKKQVISERKSALEDKLARQQRTVMEKTKEESNLVQRSAEHKSLLEQVRRDNAQYLEQIRRKQAAANKIERLVSDLIERERMRRMAARTAGKKATTSGKKGGSTVERGAARITDLPSRPISETVFGRLKGRLPWPVSSGAVVGTFGEQINKRLGTVTISNGIDIEVPPGSPVRAVADGTVSTVYFIPGYGNLIIISHDDDFFTVYAHLSEIAVRVDQNIRAGATIARSGEGVVGPQIHFELWRERAKQNPLNWLSPR